MRNKAVAIAFATVIPIVVAVGAVNYNPVTGYLPVVAFLVLVILASLGKIRNYPIYLFGLSLSLIWSASMLGTSVIGSDAPREYYLSVLAMQNGWHPADNPIAMGMSNMSAVIGVLAPWLARLLHIDLVWVYKAIFPMLLACVPVVLYCAFARQMGRLKAFFAALFFLAVPVMATGIIGIAKSMVAELFFALMILAMVSNLKWWPRMLAVLGCLAGMVVCHYTVAMVAMAYIVAMYAVPGLVATYRHRWLDGLRTFATLAIVIVSIVGFGHYYYSNYGGNSVYTATRKLLSWAPYLGAAFGEVEAVSPSVEESQYRSGNDVLPAIIMKEYRIPNKDEQLLGQWPSLVRAGLAVDIMEVSLPGKLFRVIHLLTILVLGVGIIVLLRKHGHFRLEFVGGIIASGLLLLMCLVVPWFSQIISMARIYHLTLFFVAPLFVVGVTVIPRIKWQYVTAGLLATYFIFTSGAVYELTKSEAMAYIDTPYSFSLSGQRTGLVVSPTRNDLQAVEWVVNDTPQDTHVVSDFNGVTLLATHMLPTPRLKRYRWDDVWLVVRYPAEGGFYVFVNERSVRTGDVILPIAPGLRLKAPMPDYVYDGELVFDNGARVYYFENETGVDK